MHIEHIAIWADNLEVLRTFYTRYFALTYSPPYVNRAKGFTSCFLTFDEGGARIELMHVAGLGGAAGGGPMRGLAHLAISEGSPEAVRALSRRLQADGHTLLSGPRTTGDGYYESVVADPEGNRIEITV